MPYFILPFLLLFSISPSKLQLLLVDTHTHAQKKKKRENPSRVVRLLCAHYLKGTFNGTVLLNTWYDNLPICINLSLKATNWLHLIAQIYPIVEGLSFFFLIACVCHSLHLLFVMTITYFLLQQNVLRCSAYSCMY